MASKLKRLTIKGFKSIDLLENFDLSNLNILIGGNGAGKSNFVEIFRMLRAMVDENFANYIISHGGCDDFLFNGPKQSSQIEMDFHFGDNAYSFILQPTSSEKFFIRQEKFFYQNLCTYTGENLFESQLKVKKDEKEAYNSERPGVGSYVFKSISNWIVYHFHDTSETAPMRRSEITADNQFLRNDAGNIAPFLLKLRNQAFPAYNEIIEVVRLVTPFFDDFILRPVQQGLKESVNLSWKQKGSDYPMQPYHLSDGTIRFICLAAALLQPELPSIIVIDEPELGLHPYAIEILAELIQAASQKTQIIISTQSPSLVDCFESENIIVVNRKDGASVFSRLQPDELNSWLEDYSLGELWRKNVLT